MARTTSPEQLEEMAQRLDREASRLRSVRLELRRDVEATRSHWEGRVAERFRNHTGPRYRQSHIDVAHDRLDAVAKMLRAAAREQGSRRP